MSFGGRRTGSRQIAATHYGDFTVKRDGAIPPAVRCRAAHRIAFETLDNPATRTTRQQFPPRPSPASPAGLAQPLTESSA